MDTTVTIRFCKSRLIFLKTCTLEIGVYKARRCVDIFVDRRAPLGTNALLRSMASLREDAARPTGITPLPRACVYRSMSLLIRLAAAAAARRRRRHTGCADG